KGRQGNTPVHRHRRRMANPGGYDPRATGLRVQCLSIRLYAQGPGEIAIWPAFAALRALRRGSLRAEGLPSRSAEGAKAGTRWEFRNPDLSFVGAPLCL